MKRRGMKWVAVLVAVICFGLGFSARGWGAGSCCQGLSLKAAARILKVKPADLTMTSRHLMVSPDDTKNGTYKAPPCDCAFRSRTDFLKSIHYVTYTYNDPARARATFRKMRSNFSTVSKVDKVPSLGDDAFYAGDSRFKRLVVLKGSLLIDIRSPRIFRSQKEIARFVLEK